MSDRYMMNGNKMAWHADRVRDWLNGKRIAPIHIDVGLSKGCNIRCHYCFGVLQGNFYKQGSEVVFPREALLRYMREAGEAGVRSMALIGEAEPTLNPALYEAIVAGKTAGVDMALGTNGILLDTGLAGERALEHLTWIRFNISAASDEAYRVIHGSKQFATALEKIRFAAETKARRGLSITVGLQMVLTPRNVDQVVPLARLGRQLGVDYLEIKQCGDTTDSKLGVYDKLHQYADFTDLLKEAETHGTDSYAVIVKWHSILKRGRRAYPECLGAPFLLYSSGDGRLYPCGMFFNHREEEFRMGDLTTHGFKEILESERYWQVVEQVRTGISVPDCYTSCRSDSVNDYLWRAKTEGIPDRIGDPPPHVNFI